MALLKRRFTDKSEDSTKESAESQNQLELDMSSPAQEQAQTAEVQQTEPSAGTEETTPAEGEEKARVVVKPRRKVVVTKSDGDKGVSEKTDRRSHAANRRESYRQRIAERNAARDAATEAAQII